MTATGTAVAAKATVTALESALDELYDESKAAAKAENDAYNAYRAARTKAENLDAEVQSMENAISIMKERSKA